MPSISAVFVCYLVFVEVSEGTNPSGDLKYLRFWNSRKLPHRCEKTAFSCGFSRRYLFCIHFMVRVTGLETAVIAAVSVQTP